MRDSLVPLPLLTCIYLISSSCRLGRSDEEREELQKEIEEARREAAQAQATAAQGDEMAASAQIDGSSSLDRPHLPVAESEVVQ